MNSQRQRQRGQGLVETGIVIVFLSILLIGIMGFGRIMSASIRLEQAAREGARIAGTGGDNAAIQLKALQTLSLTGDATKIPGTYWMKITPNAAASRTFNTACTVEIWWNYPVPVPVFRLFVKQRLLYANNIQAVTVGVPSSS